MPKSEGLLEVISAKLPRFNLDQIEEVATAIKCIEAGKEAVGSKVYCLLKELESTKAHLDYHKSECVRWESMLSDYPDQVAKNEKLEKRIGDLKNEIRRLNRKLNSKIEQNVAQKLTEEKGNEKLSQKVKELRIELRITTKKLTKAVEEKEELEFAVSNLQETVLKLRGSKVA